MSGPQQAEMDRLVAIKTRLRDCMEEAPVGSALMARLDETLLDLGEIDLVALASAVDAAAYERGLSAAMLAVEDFEGDTPRGRRYTGSPCETAYESGVADAADVLHALLAVEGKQ